MEAFEILLEKFLHKIFHNKKYTVFSRIVAAATIYFVLRLSAVTIRERLLFR